MSGWFTLPRLRSRRPEYARRTALPSRLRPARMGGAARRETTPSGRPTTYMCFIQRSFLQECCIQGRGIIVWPPNREPGCLRYHADTKVYHLLTEYVVIHRPLRLEPSEEQRGLQGVARAPRGARASPPRQPCARSSAPARGPGAPWPTGSRQGSSPCPAACANPDTIRNFPRPARGIILTQNDVF